MGKKYIAYGSNLSLEQMKDRCPGARVMGMARIRDWKLVFRTHATLEPSPGGMVPVVIWEITESDERNLDLYEGYPTYYHKEEMTVVMTDLAGENPEEVTAMVYLMEKGHELRAPQEDYFLTLAEGYARFGFGLETLKMALEEAKA